jgi:hypothetical protein
MTTRFRAGKTAAVLLSLTLLTSACTGGSESNAADEPAPGREAPAGTAQEQANARAALQSISDAIPVYAGADHRTDLTKRDEVMVRGRYGDGAQVYTLATNDSFPQVYHYYTTYLAQFRGFPAQDTYPPERKDWRTLEVQLNEAMQDPFIPGRALDLRGRQVTLQVVETEAEPRTVIRYIVTPAPPATSAVAGVGVATAEDQVLPPATSAPAPGGSAGSAPSR